MIIVRIEAKSFNGMSEFTVVKDTVDELNGYEPYKAVVRHIINHNNKAVETNWTECSVLRFPHGSSAEEVIERITHKLYLDGYKYKLIERS